MRKLFADFFRNFKLKKLRTKISLILVAVLYVFIVTVCLVRVEVEFTSPGTVTRVSQVIEINGDADDEDDSKVYTVSVYSKTKISLAQYFISKYFDKNIDVRLVDHEDSAYTVSERDKMDVCAKKQSIQDSLIVAYNYAKDEGKDIELVYSYMGVCVCAIPANYYGTGPESLMIGDVVTAIGDKEITSMNVFREIVEFYYDEYLKDNKVTIPVIKLLRNGKEVTLNACNAKVVANLGGYSKASKENNEIRVNEYYFYDYYQINYATSNPSISIQNYNTVGPSGGLMQAIYIYNEITGSDIINDYYLVGTGTISNDGSIGSIGSIKQKLITADIYMADYFFVSGYDYEDALKYYKKIDDVSFELVRVDKFEDAIKFLQNIKNSEDK